MSASSQSGVRKIAIKAEAKTDASQDPKNKHERNAHATEVHKATEISLMQPELLNPQRLQETLKVYRIPLKGDETRNELLKLFEDHVRPKPQRLISNLHKTNTLKNTGEQVKAASHTTSAQGLPTKRTLSGEGATLDAPTAKKHVLPAPIPGHEASSGISEGAQQRRRSSGGTDGGSVGSNSGSMSLPRKRNAPVEVGMCVCVCACFNFKFTQASQFADFHGFSHLAMHTEYTTNFKACGNFITARVCDCV